MDTLKAVGRQAADRFATFDSADRTARERRHAIADAVTLAVLRRVWRELGPDDPGHELVNNTLLDLSPNGEDENGRPIGLALSPSSGSPVETPQTTGAEMCGICEEGRATHEIETSDYTGPICDECHAEAWPQPSPDAAPAAPPTFMGIPVEVREDLPRNAIGIEQNGVLVGGIVNLSVPLAPAVEPEPSWDQKAKWFAAGRRSAFDGLIDHFNEAMPGRYTTARDKPEQVNTDAVVKDCGGPWGQSSAVEPPSGEAAPATGCAIQEALDRTAPAVPPGAAWRGQCAQAVYTTRKGVTHCCQLEEGHDGPHEVSPSEAVPLAPTPPERQVWVDLDGVLADFDAHYHREFGVKLDRNGQEPPDLWENISTRADWFESLPLMRGAQALWDALRPYQPKILTGLSPENYANGEGQKRRWVARHFGPEVEVVVCRSKHKCHHGKPGDILIDDWHKYSHLWNGMGGVFVMHRHNAETLAIVHALMSSPSPGAVETPLTPDDWDQIEDGLAESIGASEREADLWAGRKREQRYRDEMARAQATLDKVQALRSGGSR